ncbi:MAG: stalk domain-containing protein [Anaerovoracaceae bacterium]
MNFKKIIVTLLIIALVISQSLFAFADTVLVPSKVLAYHKPNVTLLFNDEEMGFTDVNGVFVYPIIYGGTTYIPVRGVSELMGERVEWEAKNQIVFIGKTISQPFKGSISDPVIKEPAPSSARPGESVINVYLKPDVKIMYDFDMQEFKDVNGKTVYPIIYNGTTYLPIRAIAGLMNADITWDSNTQTVSVSKEIKPEKNISENVTLITDLFNQAVDLYNHSTNKISLLQSTADKKVLGDLATSLSSDYTLAKANTSLGREMAKKAFNDKEKDAYTKLMDFLELAEYYTLVLENISYMASNGQDYSMYADTFLTFALESSKKMDAAREAIQAL